MLEQKRREAMRNETIPKRFQSAMGTVKQIQNPKEFHFDFRQITKILVRRNFNVTRYK